MDFHNNNGIMMLHVFTARVPGKDFYNDLQIKSACFIIIIIIIILLLLIKNHNFNIDSNNKNFNVSFCSCNIY